MEEWALWVHTCDIYFSSVLHYACGNTHCSLLRLLLSDAISSISMHLSYSTHFSGQSVCLDSSSLTERQPVCTYACTWCSLLLWDVPFTLQRQYLGITASSFYSLCTEIVVDFSTMDSSQHFIPLAAGARWFLPGSLERLYSLTPALSTADVLFSAISSSAPHIQKPKKG